MITSEETLRYLMHHANELRDNVNTVTTFSSTDTGQLFAVLTIDQLNKIAKSEFK